MKNYTGGFMNPLFISGLMGMGGYSRNMGDALMQGALLQNEQQTAQMQAAAQQAKLQELANEQLVSQKIAELIPTLDSDQNIALKQLTSTGMKPIDAATFLSKLRQGQESDFFTGPGRVRYMVRRNPETGKIEAQIIPGQNLELGSEAATGPAFLKPEKKISIETGLRKEITAQSKNWNAINDAYGHIKTAAKNPSPAGDIALIYGYMKMLDPTSVVREGEYATAANAGGVPEKIRAKYNQIVKGERLTPDIRKDFVRIASDLHQVQKKNHTALVDSYRDLAARNGVNPSNVVLPLAEEESFEETNFIPPSPVNLIGEMSTEELEKRANELRSKGK